MIHDITDVCQKMLEFWIVVMVRRVNIQETSVENRFADIFFRSMSTSKTWKMDMCRESNCAHLLFQTQIPNFSDWTWSSPYQRVLNISEMATLVGRKLRWVIVQPVIPAKQFSKVKFMWTLSLGITRKDRGVSEVHSDWAHPQTPSQRTRPKRGWACSARLAATTWRQAPP